MSMPLRIFALVLVIVYFSIIFRLLKRKRFALKYSLLWLLSGSVMLILVIWPKLLTWFVGLFGIEVASNGLFAMCIFLEVMITISLTSVISGFSVKIKGLIQNVALLEERIRVLEKQIDGEQTSEEQ